MIERPEIIEIGNMSYLVFSQEQAESMPHLDLSPGAGLVHVIESKFSRAKPLSEADKRNPNNFSVPRDVQLFNVEGYFYEWYSDYSREPIWVDISGLEDVLLMLRNCMYTRSDYVREPLCDPHIAISLPDVKF